MPWNPITLLKPARWIRKHNMHSTRMKQKEQGPAQQRAPDDDELSFIYVYLIQKGEKINFLNNHTIIWNRRVFLSNFLCSSFASFIDARYWPASRKEQNNDICNVSVCLCVSVSLCERECIGVHEQTIINHEESSNCVQGFIEVCVQTPSRK